jgi:PPK2 family polyphosphate:nucleotide phosphotransferase
MAAECTTAPAPPRPGGYDAAMARPYALALDGSKKVHLDKCDPAETAGLEKEEGLARLQKLGEELTELVNLLSFAGQHALLVVVQGRDASGKDGTIRKVLDFCNVLTVRAESFKVPTEEERAHDFLWRVHRVAPRRGWFTMFNRSHYEDVIAARVHGFVPKERWRARYDHINAWESLLADNDTLLLKFYLHVSREEQHQRLLEREKGPRTAWKLNPNDWKELPLWDEVTKAYEDALDRCSSPDRPFYLVPGDRKWFRNLAVVERIVLTLRPFREQWLERLEAMGKESLEEIRKIRRIRPSAAKK